MGWTARVDKPSCQSSGRCLAAAPEVFAWDEDHLASVRSEAPVLPPGRLREIARNCPAMAIALYDERGREVDPFEASEKET